MSQYRYNYTSKFNLVHMCYETLLVFQELYSIALASSNVYFIFEKLITTNCFDCNFNWFKLPLKLQSRITQLLYSCTYIHILTDISTRMESNTYPVNINIIAFYIFRRL